MLVFPRSLKTESVHKLYLLKLVLLLLHLSSKNNRRADIQNLAYKRHMPIHKLVNRINTIGSFINSMHPPLPTIFFFKKGNCY